MATKQEDPDQSDVPETADRCAELTLADGGIIIYDTKNHTAWIESSDVISLPDIV